jgi:hypothetical protein
MTGQLRMNCNRVQRALEGRNHPGPNESALRNAVKQFHGENVDIALATPGIQFG